MAINLGTPDKRRLADLTEFAGHQLRSKDMDPLYPVLEYLQRGMPAERALWHSMVYVAFYNIASSTQFFEACPEPDLLLLESVDAELFRLPTGIERRGLRGGTPMRRHLEHLVTLSASFKGFRPLLMAGGVTGRVSWWQLMASIQQIHGNGRWAAYKLAEILYRVHGFPTEPADMGNAHSSGPRKGLSIIFGGDAPEGNDPAAIRLLDARGEYVLAVMRQAGLSIDIAQVETALCNFKSLYAGKYYVGHDIDEMQEVVNHADLPRDTRVRLYAARRAALPEAYLGEAGGWHGVDKDRAKAYARGEGILIRDEPEPIRQRIAVRV
jgi:hypothetical protein